MRTKSRMMVGDCLGLLRDLPSESVDAVVTDPPYGLSFMGKAWDYDVPKADIWREVLRVLKPGGHLLSFFGSRTYHRGVVQIEDAGFEIRDSLMWLYGTGFPKSLNVGKAIDAAAGVERGHSPDVRNGPNTKSGTKGDKYSLGYANQLREDTGPSTEAAAQWEGWGTALKPAHEPIVLARKPLVGTVAANVQAHGTGALNIDGCRVQLAGESDAADFNGKNRGKGSRSNSVLGDMAQEPRALRHDASGRWPANVLLDEEAAAVLDEQSGTLKAGVAGKRNAKNGEVMKTGLGAYEEAWGGFGDSGGASRFFYCAKASRKERDAGCDHLPPKSGGEATDREDGSIGTENPRAGAGRTGGARNHHPTVKPVALMRWLVRLITPPGGTVLDPFTGSGTTGVAAMAEGFHFIGMEREEQYVAIARARLEQQTPRPRPTPSAPKLKLAQLTLFVTEAA